ncbi:MAG TPA: alpha/beta hydrolase [Casimicrobiaceae bacterium]|nr:alpha/beta hydrolase [Casimicrobiaceae bacterium]
MSLQLTREEVERGYNNRAAVPDHAQWFARWAELSDAARASLDHELDVRYGPGAKETLDIFRPRGESRGTLFFIHGGYWRALDKREHAFVAPMFTERGYAVVNVNYDLCPDVTIERIVEECRRALMWVVRSGPAHGLDARTLVTSGHSAGGHLTAMLHATDWPSHGVDANPVAGGVSLSGVHDLEPLVQFSFNSDFRLDAIEARRLSPVYLQPTTRAPFVIAAGANETSEFLRQSELLWEAWPDNRPAGAVGPMFIAGRHHFDVVLDYCDADSALSRATLALFEAGNGTAR